MRMISSTGNKPYLQYPADVLSGKVVAGEHIRLACERFFSLMEDDRYEFRPECVDNVIRLFLH